MDDEKKTADKSPGTGWTRIADSIKGGKGRKIVIIAGLVGMALILLSEFWPGQKASGTSAKTTAEEFLTKTEAKLSEVTLENGVEYVYATQQKVNTDRQEGTDGSSTKLNQRDDTEENIVIVETENGRQGLLVTELQPTVKGVVIVCEGGDQPLVQQRVTEAVTIALNISSKRVCVTKLTE